MEKFEMSREWLRDKLASGPEPDHFTSSPCGCIGPQNGEPLCPCQMRGVTIKDGRYVRVQDLGPAPKAALRDRVQVFNA